KGIFQFRTRFELRNSVLWGGDGHADQSFSTEVNRFVKHAFGAANFFDEQLRISLGKFGDTAFENAGDELWDNPEFITGARFEFKPAAVKGLNIGLWIPAVTNGSPSAFLKAEDYFQELGFGLRYDDGKNIDARVSFRLDSDGDGETTEFKDLIDPADPSKKVTLKLANDYGAKFLYRVVPKVIGSFVPGLSVWVNGRIEGIKMNDGVQDSRFATAHWLYVKYAQGNLTGAALRLGLDTWSDKVRYGSSGNYRYITHDLGSDAGGNLYMPVSGNSYNKLAAFYIKPVFTYKVFSWMELGLWLKADLVLAYQEGSQVAGNDPSVFDQIAIEPSINFSLGNGFTIKPVYNMTVKMANGASSGEDKTKVDNVFELRLVYSF
ncbi:MAG: hypothetical protein LBD29_06810, partial [Treponema sp.]|nr:hypothetical protein [Treponema sp.]